jgi:hypothetical protein
MSLIKNIRVDRKFFSCRIIYASFFIFTSAILSIPTIHVLPIAYELKTNSWFVLLGHDRNGYWTDFSAPYDTSVETVLHDQTNGIFTAAGARTNTFKTAAGTTICFVRVPFIAASVLSKNACNSIKDAFAWVPAVQIKEKKEIMLPYVGHQVAVSQDVLTFLRVCLPSITEKQALFTIVLVPTEVKNKLLSWLPNEKQYKQPDYHHIDEDTKNLILSLLPSYSYEQLVTALRKKLTKAEFTQAEEQEVIRQYLIETILTLITPPNTFSFSSAHILKNIETLHVGTSHDRKEFDKHLKARQDSGNTIKLTAVDRISCNTKPIQ